MKKNYYFYGIMIFTMLLLPACTAQNQADKTQDNTLQIETKGQNSANTLSNGNQNGEKKGQTPQMDLAAAAAKLGVTEEALKQAMEMSNNATPNPDKSNQPGQGKTPDLESAAETLGVSVIDLQEALGMSDIPKGTPPGEPPAKPDTEEISE